MSKFRPGPFSIPVRDIVHKSGQMREFDLELEVPEKWGEGLVSLAKGEDLDVQVRLEAVHEGIWTTVSAQSTYRGECGRCLSELAEDTEVEIQELFAYSSSEETDYAVQDDHVDLENLVRDAIVLSLPFQPVCRDNCPGLDPETGLPRSESSDSDDSVASDPRWDALRNYGS